MKTAADNAALNHAISFGKWDYLKITLLGFALTSLWSSLHTIILPLRLLDFVPEAQKNTYLDLLIFAGLFLAFIVQPVAGAFSDVSTSKWGRRRPFIVAGAVPLAILLFGTGLPGGYAVIFALYCLMQISSNVAQGPFQALIPDLVPEKQRGRASGIRGLLLIISGVLLVRIVAVFMKDYPAHSSGFWMSLAVLGILIAGTLVYTLLAVKETPWQWPFPGTSQRRPVSPLTAALSSFRVDTKAKPGFIAFLAASFLVFTGWNTLLAHALYYFKDVTGVSSAAAATGDLVLTMGAAMIAVVFFAGWLSDKFGRRPVVIASGFLGAAGTLALLGSTAYWQILLSGSLLGLCAGAWISSQWALATDLVGKENAGKYMGMVNMSVAGAGAAARLIGPLIDVLNSYVSGLGYRVMLLACIIYFIAGSLLLLRVKISPGITPDPSV
jgi:Na+/melibiose symporter-like transporter